MGNKKITIEIRQSLNRNITEKQEQKLFNGLFDEIVNYVNKQGEKE